jgi:flagellar biosynthesis/type III secretory pathway chaperone
VTRNPANRNFETVTTAKNMTVLATHLLSELLDRKHGCLVELRELGRQQLALVESGAITQLLKVLAAKQQVFARLQQTEGQLDPFRDQRPEDRRWASPADRQRCAQLIERSEALFREILAQEKLGEQLLGERRDEAALRLHQAHAASQARGAYAAAARTTRSQLDLSSEK